MDAFEQFVRGGLAQSGIEVDDMELQVMRFADQLYGEDLRRLMAADLKGVWAEPDLDPSRAPSA